MTQNVEVVGSVRHCARFPVKSMQGAEVASVDVLEDGIAGDRSRALITADGGLVSAKQRGELLMASADDNGITLPDGRRLRYDDPTVDHHLSDWLEIEVTLQQPNAETAVDYRMTFDPPNDSAELVDIPALTGSFLDIAPIHLLTTATLDGCRNARPDLDWDLRRFRPNLLLDVDGPTFVEDSWVGRRLGARTAVLHIDQPTVRCAMPLRAQPGLDREVGLYRAMTDLNEAHPYHFGSYVSVVTPGTIKVGDEVRLLD